MKNNMLKDTSSMDKTLYLNKCKLRRKFKRNLRTVNNSMDNFEDKIENNEDLSKEQLSFANIHSQEATDSSFIKEGLVPMSEGYSRIINQFNNYPSKENYKSIVNTCINCHISMCPGPLERIDNLILK